jgi:hypothetical protein
MARHGGNLPALPSKTFKRRFTDSHRIDRAAKLEAFLREALSRKLFEFSTVANTPIAGFDMLRVHRS